MALLNTINNVIQNVLADGLLTFTSNEVKIGCKISHFAGSNAIELNGAGIYLVSVNADVVPTGAGLISMQLLRNGDPVDGALATVTGVAGETANLSFTTLVKVLQSCPCIVENDATLQVQLTAPATVSNVSATVVRVV